MRLGQVPSARAVAAARVMRVGTLPGRQVLSGVRGGLVMRLQPVSAPEKEFGEPSQQADCEIANTGLRNGPPRRAYKPPATRKTAPVA